MSTETLTERMLRAEAKLVELEARISGVVMWQRAELLLHSGVAAVTTPAAKPQNGTEKAIAFVRELLSDPWRPQCTTRAEQAAIELSQELANLGLLWGRYRQNIDIGQLAEASADLVQVGKKLERYRERA